jgi:uncharacterized protein YcsI (UPF0317 family)
VANYAVRLPRLSAVEWAGQVPLYSIYTRGYLEQEPQAAYELWLRELAASLAQRAGLERLFPIIYRGYQARSALEGPTAPDWVEYLSTLDPNRLLATLTPAMRGLEPRLYQRPLRWFAFM